MESIIKCRFCDATFDEYFQLEDHLILQHLEEFGQVQDWLEDEMEEE